jgi:Tol biopolymer transport system component
MAVLEFEKGVTLKGGGAMNKKLQWLGKLGMLVLLTLTTACLPEGVRVPQSDLLSVLERKSGLIAYIGPDNNIYIVDQSGTKPVQVTEDAHTGGSDYLIYSVPTWSLDGKSLAFAAYSGTDTSSSPETSQLFVAQKDGKHLVEAYSSPEYLIYYYWSPDSRHLSFLSDTSGSNLALKIISPEGGEPEILDVGQPYYWSWAPDSHSILAHVGDNTPGFPSHLSVLQLAENVTEEGLAIKPTNFKAPAYSPDGKQVLVAGETEKGNSALLLADSNAADQQPKTITEYAGNIAFTWSPNGKSIAYIASGETSAPLLLGKLIIVDPTGKQAPIELEDELAHAFFWSPDSKSIAYFTPYLRPQPTAEPGADSSPSQAQSEIVWSLSVLDVKSGKSHLVATFSPPERFLQILPFFDQYRHSVTIWSPDSKNLVVSAYLQDGSPGIFVVAASGNLEPRFLAEGWVGFWSWK